MRTISSQKLPGSCSSEMDVWIHTTHCSEINTGLGVFSTELQTAANKCKPTGRASLYGVAHRAALKTFTSTTLLLGNFL